jgi:hypothetical protein
VQNKKLRQAQRAQNAGSGRGRVEEKARDVSEV